mgnify:CR=1 FL=1
MEPQNEVKILQTFFRMKLKSLEKIRNLIVTEFNSGDYEAQSVISKFLRKNKDIIKQKHMECVLLKMKSLSLIELPSPPLLSKKGSKQLLSIRLVNL